MKTQIPWLRVSVKDALIVGTILPAWLAVPTAASAASAASTTSAASAQIWGSDEGRYISPRSGGATSEFGAETAVPHIRGIFDDEERLLVLVSFNTDIADGWEREGDVPYFFFTFSPPAYGLGINIILWAMSH